MTDIPDHRHDADGRIIVDAPSEASAELEAVESEVHAEVEVARIEADRDVAVAKIAAKVETEHDETEIEALRAEIRGMREILDRVVPSPELETDTETLPEADPVVVVQDAEASPEAVPAPPEAEHREKHSSHSMSKGWWS